MQRESSNNFFSLASFLCRAFSLSLFLSLSHFIYFIVLCCYFFLSLFLSLRLLLSHISLLFVFSRSLFLLLNRSPSYPLFLKLFVLSLFLSHLVFSLFLLPNLSFSNILPLGGCIAGWFSYLPPDTAVPGSIPSIPPKI